MQLKTQNSAIQAFNSPKLVNPSPSHSQHQQEGKKSEPQQLNHSKKIRN